MFNFLFTEEYKYETTETRMLYEKETNELYDFIRKLSLRFTDNQKWEKFCFHLNIRNDTDKRHVLMRYNYY